MVRKGWEAVRGMIWLWKLIIAAEIWLPEKKFHSWQWVHQAYTK